MFHDLNIDGFLLVRLNADLLLELLHPEVAYPLCARFERDLFRRIDLDAGKPYGPSINDLSHEELQDFILELFILYDADKSGGLNRREFKECLSNTYLNLSNKEVRKIMAEADEDDDGVIAYSEFVDVMVNIVIMSKALQRVADQKKVASKQSTDIDTHLCPP